MIFHTLCLALCVSVCRAEAGIYLSINALASEDDAGEVVKRRIEVNWYGDTVSEGDTIAVNCQSCDEVVFSPADFQDGFLILPGNLPYPQLSYSRSCVFGYNATWFDANQNVKASNCLQSEPTWMEDNKSVFKLQLNIIKL